MSSALGASRDPLLPAMLVATLACGCARSPGHETVPPASAASAPAAAVDTRPVILFLGTSLTAGLGIDPGLAYPALIQKRLDANGKLYRAVNAGVSGETSAAARRRVDWLLRQNVAVIVIETGANDGLRGHDPERLRENLQGIVERARRQQPPPKLLLVGMHAPRNYGEEYARRFRSVYQDVARKNDVSLIPFLLDGVAGIPSLNQADGIHPTAEGQRRIADTVWKSLEPLL